MQITNILLDIFIQTCLVNNFLNKFFKNFFLNSSKNCVLLKLRKLIYVKPR